MDVLPGKLRLVFGFVRVRIRVRVCVVRFRVCVVRFKVCAFRFKVCVVRFRVWVRVTVTIRVLSVFVPILFSESSCSYCV